jgi:hypothetical protein
LCLFLDNFFSFQNTFSNNSKPTLQVISATLLTHF